jgi:DNA-directed RNA polymerase specialized sigma24 family protein
VTGCKIQVFDETGEPVIAKSLTKGWTPGPGAFDRLLHWLDGELESNGETYLAMRRRLVAYFDRKRCAAPDDLADDTLNRVARRLEEEGAITDAPPARYCYIVAKFVFLEYLRRVKVERELVTDPAEPPQLEDEATDEAALRCLDRCLQGLPAADRELILEYYSGERRAKIDRRKALAARLRLTTNALSIRACRIRSRLEACVSACAEEREMFPRRSS